MRIFHRDLHEKLDRILFVLNLLLKGEHDMDASIQAIIDQAKKNVDAESAATQAIKDLGVKLLAAIANAGSLSDADRATLQAEVTDMQNSAAAVSAAIVSGTPAA